MKSQFRQKTQNQVDGHGSPKNHISGHRISGNEPKPKYETVTIREFTMPTPVSASPTRIRAASSSATHTQPSRGRDEPKNKQSDKEKSDIKPRTIWDMDCSEPLDPNHIPNYSTPSRRSRDTTQRSGLVRPSWRRSLSGTRNNCEGFSNNVSSKSTTEVNQASIRSEAFGSSVPNDTPPKMLRRNQPSTVQTQSARRPLSSSLYIPSPPSSSKQPSESNNSDKLNLKTSLLIEKSVQPIQQR